ncbi:YjbQ family protein [candidate division FCPU426 bacterium]|nr:YjbQ family protein [candidate division FCPU426 bacterium]
MLTTTKEISVPTRQAVELINVTGLLQRAVAESGVREGLVVVQAMHTTAGITVNENADPDVLHDLILQLDRIAPNHRDFRHAEGNSAAHIKSSLVGSSATVLVSQGRLVLGTWQGVYFCEFDGPRQRKLLVRILGE